MITKFYSRKEIQVAAGKDPRTIYRWLSQEQQLLQSMGVKSYELLPPQAVEYICQKHRIDMTKLP